MRLIGTLSEERQAMIFSQFLQKKGVTHQIEVQTNTDWGSSSYGSHQCEVWIYDEDQLNDVLKWFHDFKENPLHPIFHQSSPSPVWIQSDSSSHVPLEPPQNPTPSLTTWDRQPMGWLTKSLLAVCCILFFLAYLLMPLKQVPEHYSGLALFTSPVEKALLYDYPKLYSLINEFIKLYGYEELENPKTLSSEGQQLLQQIHRTPFWPGIYQLVLKGGWRNIQKGFQQYPTFEKIKEGEIWRLFTPCLLHADLFHLFFNMLWLIVLGKQMEQRLKPLRYGIFVLVVGIISNTAQYLMSGPNFIGFSGILCGMLAFIWVRQKLAAWEGYQVDRLTLIFMLVFIIGMAFLQLLSFLVEKSFDLAFSPNIANVAHLVGGLMGFIFGRSKFFSWRHT